jgi:hypothetical protein
VVTARERERVLRCELTGIVVDAFAEVAPPKLVEAAKRAGP